MTLYIPESSDSFGWAFLILVASFTPIFILLDCLKMPLSYSKFTNEGFSSRLAILNCGMYNYRTSFLFIYGLPLLAIPSTCLIIIISDAEHIDADLSSNNEYYFVTSICMIMIYFIKRTLEIGFVHQYSHNKVPISSVIFMIIIYNIGFIGIAQSICKVIINYHDHNNHIIAVVIGLIIYIPSIIYNYILHVQLKNIRLRKGTRNYISLDELPKIFGIVMCPHYISDIFIFIGVLIVIRTLIMLLLVIAMSVFLLTRMRRTKIFYDNLLSQDEKQESPEFMDKEEQHDLTVNEKGQTKFAPIDDTPDSIDSGNGEEQD